MDYKRIYFINSNRKNNDENMSNGKIYRIYSETSNYPPYYGSTTQSLRDRMLFHCMESNRCMSRLHIDAGNAVIELVENFPCKSRKELIDRERYYINTFENCNKIYKNVMMV